MKLTENEQYAVGAAAILIAAIDDNLRDLSASDRVIALRGREMARDLLTLSGIQPTALKDLGLKLIAAAKG